jgi:hypothetical protein
MAGYGPHLDSFRHYSYVLSGQRTATVTIQLCQTPWPGKIANPATNARASGGTTPTLTVDLQVGSTSKLSAAMEVDATPVWVAGTVATDPSVAEGDAIETVLTIGGTNPTWDDVVVEFDLVRS